MGVVIAGGGGYYFFTHRSPTAGLKIDTNPPSLVFIDNRQVGRTPLDKYYAPGEFVIKLIPDSTSSALTTYQTKVHLTDKAITVVKRDFSSSEAGSSGEIISLQPLPDSSNTAISIITSSPESASVALDGQPQGLTPLSISTVTPNDHLIAVSAPGFISRTVNAKSVQGFRLLVNVKLAIDPTAVPFVPTPAASSSASLVASSSAQLTILSTPVGFLRVRSSPSTAGTEVGQVKPGEKYDILDSKADWYLIKLSLPATSSGWISSQYAKKN